MGYFPGNWFQQVYSQRSYHLLTHWGRDIFQTVFWNAFSWIKLYQFRLIFNRSLPIRVKLTKIKHWLRKWLGADQATSHYLNQGLLIYWRIYAALGLNELEVYFYQQKRFYTTQSIFDTTFGELPTNNADRWMSWFIIGSKVNLFFRYRQNHRLNSRLIVRQLWQAMVDIMTYPTYPKSQWIDHNTNHGWSMQICFGIYNKF